MSHLRSLLAWLAYRLADWLERAGCVRLAQGIDWLDAVRRRYLSK